MKKLYRSREDKKIAGVCGGIAEYFGWDSTIVRFAAAVLMFVWGTGLLAYVLAWIIIPEKPAHIDVDYEVSSEPVYDQQNEDKKGPDSNNK